MIKMQTRAIQVFTRVNIRNKSPYFGSKFVKNDWQIYGGCLVGNER